MCADWLPTRWRDPETNLGNAARRGVPPTSVSLNCITRYVPMVCPNAVR
jgi:hypothetical protein